LIYLFIIITIITNYCYYTVVTEQVPGEAR